MCHNLFFIVAGIWIYLYSMQCPMWDETMICFKGLIFKLNCWTSFGLGSMVKATNLIDEKSRLVFVIHDSVTGTKTLAGPILTKLQAACHLAAPGTNELTHLSLDKMAAISQTAFSNAFLWLKEHKLRFKFHWTLFLRVQFTIFQHWFR